MIRLDNQEKALIGDFDKGKFRSIATQKELENYRVAARATLIKDRKVKVKKKQPGQA